LTNCRHRKKNKNDNYLQTDRASSKNISDVSSPVQSLPGTKGKGETNRWRNNWTVNTISSLGYFTPASTRSFFEALWSFHAREVSICCSLKSRDPILSFTALLKTPSDLKSLFCCCVSFYLKVLTEAFFYWIKWGLSVHCAGTCPFRISKLTVKTENINTFFLKYKNNISKYLCNISVTI